GLLGVLVIAGIADRGDGGPVGRMLSARPLVYLGRISYGLYLYHWPIYLLLVRRPERLTTAAWITAMAISVLVAAVSHRFLEEPIRRGALTGRIARAAIPIGLGLASIAILTATLDARPAGDDWDRYLVHTSIPDAPTVVF